jgi:hypothetical protein
MNGTAVAQQDSRRGKRRSGGSSPWRFDALLYRLTRERSTITAEHGNNSTLFKLEESHRHAGKGVVFLVWDTEGLGHILTALVIAAEVDTMRWRLARRTYEKTELCAFGYNRPFILTAVILAVYLFFATAVTLIVNLLCSTSMTGGPWFCAAVLCVKNLSLEVCL